MSSSLVFNRVYRLKILLVMLLFSTQLCELLPLPKVNFQYPVSNFQLETYSAGV
jgi:hypothetical protein